MDARYLKAISVLPDQDKVCGRTLKAFCLRHRVILEAIESPFVNMKKGVEITPYDVIIAVRILSTYDKAEMVGPFTFWENYELHRMRMSKKRLAVNAGKIIGIMVECLSYPKLWSKHDKSTGNSNKQANIPWTLTCVANNVRNGATEILRAADDLAMRNERQAGTVEETAAAMRDVTLIVAQSARATAGVRDTIARPSGQQRANHGANCANR
jgi:hypothetical protein